MALQAAACSVPQEAGSEVARQHIRPWLIAAAERSEARAGYMLQCKGTRAPSPHVSAMLQIIGSMTLKLPGLDAGAWRRWRL